MHVECGTLAMGQSIHNASVGRVPVLCFAGMSPFTQDGELLGSRTEYYHSKQIQYEHQLTQLVGSFTGYRTFRIKLQLYANIVATLPKLKQVTILNRWSIVHCSLQHQTQKGPST